jgi:hypothetical protein
VARDRGQATASPAVIAGRWQRSTDKMIVVDRARHRKHNLTHDPTRPPQASPPGRQHLQTRPSDALGRLPRPRRGGTFTVSLSRVSFNQSQSGAWRRPWLGPAGEGLLASVQRDRKLHVTWHNRTGTSCGGTRPPASALSLDRRSNSLASTSPLASSVTRVGLGDAGRVGDILSFFRTNQGTAAGGARSLRACGQHRTSRPLRASVGNGLGEPLNAMSKTRRQIGVGQ